MKKITFLMALAALLSAPLCAQDELTVADGTQSNYYIPLYGNWIDAAQHNQIIYPEDSVADMVGGTITGMTFYLSSTASSAWGTTVTVRLGTTLTPNLASGFVTTDLTQVWQGTVTGTNPTWSIEFDNEFVYDGGNLLVDITSTAATYSQAQFRGVTVSNASRYSYNSNNSAQNFLPKTTFDYSASGDVCRRPLALYRSNFGSWSTDLHWTVQDPDDIGDYAIYVNGQLDQVVLGDTVATISLQPLTEYMVAVARVCDVDDTSSLRTLSFKTPCDDEVYADLPFTSGFEDLETGEMPDCWLQVATGSSGVNTIFPSAYKWAPNAHNSTVYFEFESSHQETEILALPRMEDIPNLQLSFYAVTTNSTNGFILEAGVVEEGDDGEYVFVPVDTVPLVASSDFAGGYHVYNVFFTNYEGDGERIALRTTPTGSAQYTLMIDDFTVIYAGIPVLGPFSQNTYSVAVGDTLTLTANVMAGEVTNYEWTSDMITAGTCVIAAQGDNWVKLVYTADGIDNVTLTASNDAGSVSRTVTVTALAGPVTEFPYFTGFEPGDDLSWRTANNVNGWYVGSATSYAGDQSLYLSSDLGATNTIADGVTCHSYAYRLLEFSEAGEYTLSFKWKGNGNSSRYARVYIAQGAVEPTQGSSPSSSWTALGDNLLAASDWTEFGEIFSAQAGQYTVILYWYGYSGTITPPHAVDNIAIVPLTCPRPTGIALTDVSTETLTVGWTAVGEESAWSVRLNGGEWQEVTDNPYTFTGLTANTAYSFDIRAICGSGDTSLVQSASFRTDCGTVTDFPWNEPFNTADDFNCWTPLDFNNNSGDNWIYSGGQARCNYTYGVTAHDWLISPAVTLPSDGEGLVLTWDAYSNSSNGNLAVRISTAGTDTASFSTVLHSGQLPTTSTTYNISLADYAGETVRFAFVNTSTGSYVYLDNVQTRSTLLPVVSVSGPAMFDINDTPVYRVTLHEGSTTGLVYTWTSAEGNTLVADADSATLTVSAVGTDVITVTATNAYGSASASIEVSAVDLQPASVPFVSGFEGDADNWLLINGSTNAWHIGTAMSHSGSNGLYISQDGGSTSGYDINTEAISYAVRYLTFDEAGAYTLNIDWQVAGEGSYDFVRLFLASPVELTANQAPAGMGTVTTGVPEGWISLNPASGYLNLGYSWQTHTANFNISAAGNYMFVIMWRNDGSQGSAPVALDNVNIYPQGEAPEVCEVPTGLSYSNVASTSASIDWTPAGGEQMWQLDVDGTLVDVSAHPYVVSDLEPGSQHTVSVRAVCSEESYSEWSASVTFTTDAEPEPCNAPTGLTYSNVTATSATLDWTPSGSESQWELELNGTAVTLPLHPYPLVGLTAGTQYTARVRAVCAAGEYSDWSASVTFTTEQLGIDDLDQAPAFAVYPNPASTTLTLVAGEPATATIVDMSGRTVMTLDIRTSQVDVDITALTPGAYFVRLRSEQATSVRKLIVR